MTKEPTPGPWVQHDEQYCPEEIWGALDTQENGVRGVHVCTLEDCDQMQENARLIMAAYDLLAACRLAYIEMVYLAEQCKFRPGGSCDRALKAMKSAIAKATK